MFFSYCMVFGMSLKNNPSWRLMLGVLSIPSLIYFVLSVFFLPESPRWLVSKGRMVEAKKVLQRLRGREDVAGEMALLVEGLGVGGDTAIEEYIIGPANELADEEDLSAGKDQIKLYGPEQGLSWIAKPVTGNATSAVSRQGSIANQSGLIDPLVTLLVVSMRNFQKQEACAAPFFHTLAACLVLGGIHQGMKIGKKKALPEKSPLISRQTTSLDKDMPPPAHASLSSMRQGSLLHGNAGEPAGSTGIGGGWQLAWQWSEREGADGKKEGGFKRIYLHQEVGPASRRGSMLSLAGGDLPADGEVFQAAALVSQPALYSKELLNQHPVGPAMVHPSETAAKGPSWRDLFEPGVKHALIVGVGIQILQQFSGINGVLYYTPQILEQAGVGFLLSNLGLSSTSASFLISAVTTLLMLPCIAVAMRLMDISGRRALLLSTIPVLILSLLILVLGSLVNLGSTVNASISTISVVVYFCCFVMGFGPIPNILCAEIFPTRVRGLCIAICALTFWIGDIIVTYSLPVMLNSVGLAGVFGLYAIVCLIAWAFVFMKVPETKGMPLEVIIEFFSVGAKQADAAKNN
ncbi:hypothetical protein K1719_001234 [Acacia pycnantha]|nr:hypothetical protein K1719_001234 [Acacia pycnantha]